MADVPALGFMPLGVWTLCVQPSMPFLGLLGARLNTYHCEQEPAALGWISTKEEDPHVKERSWILTSCHI